MITRILFQFLTSTKSSQNSSSNFSKQKMRTAMLVQITIIWKFSKLTTESLEFWKSLLQRKIRVLWAMKRTWSEERTYSAKIINQRHQKQVSSNQLNKLCRIFCGWSLVVPHSFPVWCVSSSENGRKALRAFPSLSWLYFWFRSQVLLTMSKTRSTSNCPTMLKRRLFQLSEVNLELLKVLVSGMLS